MKGSVRQTIASILMAFVIIGWINGRAWAGVAKASPAPSPAEEDAEAPQLEPSPEQLRFAKQYIKAVNNGDLKALRQLIAPKALACFTPRTEPYLINWLERQIEDPIASPYSIKVEKRDDHDLPLTMLFILPVAPTYQLNITTKIGGEDMVVGRPIAFQDGRWYETPPCPTDIGMTEFAQRQEGIRKEAALVEQLYAQLKDPLLSDLKSLVARGKSEEACDKYAIAAKIQRETACEVIKKLEVANAAGK